MWCAEAPTSAVVPGRGRYRTRPGSSRRPAGPAAPSSTPASAERAPGATRGRYRGGQATSTTSTEAPAAAIEGEEQPKRSRFGQSRAPGAAARPTGAFGGRRGFRTSTAKPDGAEERVEEAADKKEALHAESAPSSGEEGTHAPPARRVGTGTHPQLSRRANQNTL